MLTIRLQRAGKKNKADFRVVLAQKTAASQKKFVEVLGSYNPHTKNLQIRDQERLNYWINDQQVEVSPTVNNLLISKELIKGNKVKAFSLPKKEVAATEAEAASETVEAGEETAAQDTVNETAAEESAGETTEEATEETTPAETPAEAPAEEVEAPAEEKPADE